MASAMSPVLEILKMLEKNISIYSQVGPRIQKVCDVLFEMYDKLMEDENKRLKGLVQSLLLEWKCIC